MKAIFLIIMTSLMMLVELLLGNVGLYLPLTAYAVFYFTGSISTEAGAVTGIFAGIVLDLIYGRAVLLTPLILLAALVAGRSLRHKQAKTLIDVALPGLIIGAVAVVGAALLRVPDRQYSFSLLLWQTIWFGSVSVVLLPLTVFLLDSIAHLLVLPEFLTLPHSRLNYNPLGSRPHRVRERLVNPNSRQGGKER